MGIETPTLKLALLRNDIVVGTVQPEVGEGHPRVDFRTTGSVVEFSSASVSSRNPEVNDLFMSFDKRDVLQILYQLEVASQFEVLFQGEFRSSSIKMDTKKYGIDLEMNAVHSFYRLTLLQHDGRRHFSGITFGDYIRELVRQTGIPSKVHMSEEIAALRVLGSSYRANAFRQFKDICIQNALSVTFECDNSVLIETLESKRQRTSGSPVVHLTDDDILSGESSRSID